MANWNDRERDIKQRSVGLIGFSMMAHAGLLALLAIMPVSTQEPFGTSTGDGGTQTAFMEFQDGEIGAPAPHGLGEAPTSEANSDALIAVDTTSAANADEVSSPEDITLPKVEAPSNATKDVAVDKAVEEPILVEKTAPIKRPVVESKPIELKKVAKVPTSPKKSVVNPSPIKVSPSAEPSIVEDSESMVQTAKIEAPDTADVADNVEDTTEANDTESAPRTETADVNLPDQEESRTEDISKPVTPKTVIPTVAEASKTTEATQVSETPKVEEIKARAIVEAKEFPEATSSGATSSSAPSSDDNELNKQLSKDQSMASNSDGRSGSPGSAITGARPGSFGVPAGTQIRDAQELAAQPNNANPSYPTPDRLAGRQGVVVLVGKVLPNGMMTEVFVEKSSGSKTMDLEALQKFKSWKFKPNQEGYIRKPFQFTLSGEAKTIPARLRR